MTDSSMHTADDLGEAVMSDRLKAAIRKLRDAKIREQQRGSKIKSFNDRTTHVPPGQLLNNHRDEQQPGRQLLVMGAGAIREQEITTIRPTVKEDKSRFYSSS